MSDLFSILSDAGLLVQIARLLGPPRRSQVFLLSLYPAHCRALRVREARLIAASELLDLQGIEAQRILRETTIRRLRLNERARALGFDEPPSRFYEDLQGRVFQLPLRAVRRRMGP